MTALHTDYKNTIKGPSIHCFMINFICGNLIGLNRFIPFVRDMMGNFLIL